MSTKKNLTLLVVILLPSLLALLVPGYFGASDEMHIGWLHQMYRALSLGQFPPRFVPDLVFGYGYPLFNFVFPLPFYLGSIIHFLGFSLSDSIKTVLGLSLILSGLTMYWSVYKKFGHAGAFLSAVIYVYTPYRATDVYVRGAVGESLAFVFLPIILGSILRIIDSPKLKNIATGALGILGLILSHNIVAYMAIGIFALLILFTVNNRLQIKFLLLTVIAGLATASYFWIPAIIDSQLMRYDTVYNFIDHFPTLLQLFTPNWGWGASVPGPYDGMSFFVGFGVLVSITALLWFLFTNTNHKFRKIIFWIITVFFSSIFLMNHRSTFVWDSLPFVGFFQFPWRFLTLTTFSGAIAAAIVANSLKISLKTVVLISLLVVGIEAYKFKPNDFLGRTDDYYIDRYIPLPTASQLYRQTSTQYLRLPANSQIAPTDSQPLFTCMPECQLEILDSNPLAAKALVSSSAGTVISFNKLNFPGWVVKTDPQVNIVLDSGEFGQSVFTLPPGEYSVLVKFEQTARNKVLLSASLLALVVVLFMLIRTKKQ